MMLLTGAKDAKILTFYRKAGYNSTDKTAFIRCIVSKLAGQWLRPLGVEDVVNIYKMCL